MYQIYRAYWMVSKVAFYPPIPVDVTWTGATSGFWNLRITVELPFDSYLPKYIRNIYTGPFLAQKKKKIDSITDYSIILRKSYMFLKEKLLTSSLLSNSM